MRNIEKDTLRKAMRLYAVTDQSWLNGRSLTTVVEEALKAGITFLQLREKDLNADDLYQEAVAIQQLARKYQVPFVINDNVELARQIGADGVHVGQSDMEAGHVRAMLGDRIIGVSAGTVEEALAAEKAGADYIGVGAVYTTSTKRDARNMSVNELKAICSAVSIPVVAIGGISRDHIGGLADSGIDGIAVVSAIFAQPDISAAVQDLLIELEGTLPL